jgi:serine/threonine-protein kinase
VFIQSALILTFPSAIAVFAAARAAALQRRALEAERRAAQIGQYALKRKLGEGGMGEVWLAEHALLKRPCAVKFIRPDLAADPATAARFAREVHAVTGLTHVNTVRVYDYGRADDGSFYYVMEYLDGPPWRSWSGRLARCHQVELCTCSGRCAGRWWRRTPLAWSTGT